VYGITAGGGGGAERRQLEQKVMLANSVAQSFMSADNANSRGQRMYLARRQNSEKWTTSGPDPLLPDDVTDGGAWPQRAPAGRQQYAIGQPPHGAHPPPGHHMPSGPRPARSISMEGPSPGRHGQFLPRMAAAGPHQHGLMTGPAAAQYHQGHGPRAPPPYGYLRPARPPGSVPGVEAVPALMRTRSDSFGSLQSALRSALPADWQITQPRGVIQQGARRLSGGGEHWPSLAYMHRPAAPTQYGVSDL